MRAWLRNLLGTAEIITVIQQLNDRMESDMATVIDALRALAEQTNAVSAAQATSFSNLQGAISKLQEAIRNGEVSPEVQAAVDEVTASLTRLGDDARRADDGFEPAVEPQPEPVPPVEGGTEPAVPQVPDEPQPTER